MIYEMGEYTSLLSVDDIVFFLSLSFGYTVIIHCTGNRINDVTMITIANMLCICIIYIIHRYTICIPQTQPMMLLSQKLSLRKREVNVWSTNLPDWYSDYFSVNFVLWWWLSGTQYTPLLFGLARSSGYFWTHSYN